MKTRGREFGKRTRRGMWKGLEGGRKGKNDVIIIPNIKEIYSF